jgi:curved DNA-binding protein CbpA
MNSSECFNLLGLTPGSSEERIKQAFRKMAKTHHPDLGGSSEKFVKIQQAYEQLMDQSFRNGSASSSSSSSTSDGNGSGYWRAWDTSNSWWNRSSGAYSSDKDFDSEFEEQWRKYTQNRKRSKSRSFKARKEGARTEYEEEFEDTRSRSEHYDSERSSEGRRTGRRGKKTSPRIDIPDNFKLTCLDESKTSICGEYVRVAKFNGRVCFSRIAGDSRFIFWSNKNKDWKISDVLKDDGNCLAFLSKIHPSIDCPFVLCEFSKWMVWSDRSRRYIGMKIQADVVEEDYSTWSIEKLREALKNMGLQQNVERCFEKQELIELMQQFGNTSGHSDKKSQKISANDPIPEGQFRLCSRQRHDGVVQAPPVLSDTCKTGNNRVESFSGPLEAVEDWLMKHGDRKRFYGIFDSSRAYCFGLIWKNSKQWARASKHDW